MYYLFGRFFFLSIQTLKANPVVNLGIDTSSCSSLILDAKNAGATYLWSTTETTQTITVSTSGTYWVQVTDMTGTTADTIEVEILDVSVLPTALDTSICGPQETTFFATGNYDDYLWFDNMTGGSLIASGNPGNISIAATTTVYVEGTKLSSILFTSSVSWFRYDNGWRFLYHNKQSRVNF